MPNHINNVLIVEGRDAHTRIAKYCVMMTDSETGKPYGPNFDFNLLIPMPEVCAGVVENGLAPDIIALLCESQGMADIWTRLCRFDRNGHLGPWKGLIGFEAGEIEQRLEKAFPGCVTNARAMARCFGETGFKSWYDWSIANWGSKWNSYQTTQSGAADKTELRFQTAWSCPEPVLTALAKAENDLSWQFYAFDEGWNFYAEGLGAQGAMEITKSRNPTRHDARAIEVYRICYGQDPEFDDEEAA